MKFDESELEGGSYLGEGTHEVRISKLAAGVSKNKGTPQIEVEFASASGKTTRDWFITEGNKFKLARLAMACGFSKEDLIAGRFNVDMLPNKRVRVVREITGKTPDGKNQYENTYLPSEQAAPGQTNDELPF